MVLAVEESVEYVTEGANMVEVVQYDHSGELCVRLCRVTLFCQVGQVLMQVLGKEAGLICTHPFRCNILNEQFTETLGFYSLLSFYSLLF